MKQLILIVISLCFFNNQVFSQTTDKEIERLSTFLTNQLNNKKAKRIAVADFMYQGQQNTRIGKFIADELSLGLTTSGGNFDVVNRDKVREELYGKEIKTKNPVDLEGIGKKTVDAVNKSDTETKEEKQADMVIAGGAVINELFKGSSKKLKGVDVIIYGTIEDKGDNLRVIIEVSRNDSKKDNIGGAKGDFTKTRDIRELLDGGLAPVPQINTDQGVTTENSEIVSPGGNNSDLKFKFQNLTFEVVRCHQNGRQIDCKVNILSSGKDDVTHANKNGTRIIDANGGFEFGVSEMKLADVSGTGSWIEKALVADYPIEGVFSFTNVNRQVESIARLEIDFWSQNCWNFTATIYNIPVR